MNEGFSGLAYRDRFSRYPVPITHLKSEMAMTQELLQRIKYIFS
jgi:hypothetical protein